MFRSEKKNRIIALALALILLLAIPVSVIRILKAGKLLTGEEIIRATKAYGTITDRDGVVLYGDGDVEYYPDLYHCVTGNFSSTVSCLVKSYGKELAPKLRAIRGVKAMTEGNTMTTTLLGPSELQRLTDAFGEKGGALFAYNYQTGQIYAALSVDGETTYDGNRSLSGRYVPGSTMKVVAALVALEQDGTLLEGLSHYCEGRYSLPDGTTVDCIEGNHYGCGIVEALGLSCNGAFAQLIGKLDPNQAKATLTQMGFSLVTDETAQASLPTANIGDMVGIRAISQTGFETNYRYNDVWSLIGQGQSWVSLMDMCAIAGAVANGGESAEAYLVENVKTPKGETVLSSETVMVQRFSETTANSMDAIWSEMADAYYRQGSGALDMGISYAKTGTAQLGGGNVNKLLLGVSKESTTAFMIVVEHYRDGDPTPISIANVLAEILPKEETT